MGIELFIFHGRGDVMAQAICDWRGCEDGGISETSWVVAALQPGCGGQEDTRKTYLACSDACLARLRAAEDGPWSVPVPFGDFVRAIAPGSRLDVRGEQDGERLARIDALEVEARVDLARRREADEAEELLREARALNQQHGVAGIFDEPVAALMRAAPRGGHEGEPVVTTRARAARTGGTAKNGESAYFAVPDPDTGDMTYWFRDKQGKARGWPPRVGERAYGPAWPRRGELDDDAVREWYTTTRRPWHDRVMQAIADDPAGAAARFAIFQSRCCICGRALTDNASKVYGIGPECRAGFPATVLEVFAREMGRAHARDT